MADIIIFGGTTEGRELARWLVKRGITVLVSVATDYGRLAMEPEKGLSVRSGRLGQAGMEALIRKEQPGLVVDATHPHAQEVTRLVSLVCDTLGVERLRVVRKDEKGEEAGGFWVDTPQQAIQLLLADDRPVLLTTGSKELHLFLEEPRLRSRIYARVLPDSKVIAGCESLGIRGRQLIAMQGPFSVETNCALLHAVDAGWLVTKESGKSGGFEEKLEAAKICGAKTVIIRRPGESSGLTLEAAKRFLARRLEKPDEEIVGRTETVGQGEAVLALIGMGMGTGSQLTLEARQMIKTSDAILGAPRMLGDIQNLTEEKMTASLYLGKDIRQWLEDHRDLRRVSVIYSGDTGFYSGARSLLSLFDQGCGAWMDSAGRRICVYPGISTVSCLCARFGYSWENLYLGSSHGKDCNVIQLMQSHPRIFLLLGGSLTVEGICRELAESGMGDVWVYAGARLGYPDEQLLTGTARELLQEQKAGGIDGLAAVILEREDSHER